MSVGSESREADGTHFRYAVLPESPDARLFIELSGYANADLAQALNSLEAAIKLENEGDPDILARYLIEFGVVAYCRAFIASDVRGLLTDHLAIPPEFEVLHKEVRAFRNSTVAHSQSELSTTWPVMLIDQSGFPQVREVLAANVSQTLPLPRVKALVTLIGQLIDVLDDLREPLRERLLADARSRPVPEPTVPSGGPEYRLDESFNPRSKRKAYPSRQVLYLSGQTESKD